MLLERKISDTYNSTAIHWVRIGYVLPVGYYVRRIYSVLYTINPATGYLLQSTATATFNWYSIDDAIVGGSIGATDVTIQSEQLIAVPYSGEPATIVAGAYGYGKIVASYPAQHELQLIKQPVTNLLTVVFAVKKSSGSYVVDIACYVDIVDYDVLS